MTTLEAELARIIAQPSHQQRVHMATRLAAQMRRKDARLAQMRRAVRLLIAAGITQVLDPDEPDGEPLSLEGLLDG